jgi:hypothetical protein
MKIHKSILTAALALGVAGASQANDVFISGSTALRTVVYNALITPNLVFTNTSPIVFTGYGGSGSGDTYMAFSGTLVGGGTANIFTYWSGSEAGIADVATGKTETFISDAALNGLDNAGTPSGANAQSSTVNLAFGDNAQAYSRTTSPVLTGKEIGVVTFKFVRNAGVWTGTNVTDELFRVAVEGGAPIGQFTGANDDSSYVYVAGRDTSSGTRANVLGDTGYGILNAVDQVILTSGALADDGNTGQSSGGTLAKSLTYNTVSGTDTINGGTGFSIIAYLGYSDAATALAGTGGGVPAVECSYNGVPFSIANIENGTYNLWGNEYIYQAPSLSTVNPTALTVYNLLNRSGDTLFATAFGNPYTVGIPLSAMHASRPGPLGNPTHN